MDAKPPRHARGVGEPRFLYRSRRSLPRRGRPGSALGAFHQKRDSPRPGNRRAHALPGISRARGRGDARFRLPRRPHPRHRLFRAGKRGGERRERDVPRRPRMARAHAPKLRCAPRQGPSAQEHHVAFLRARRRPLRRARREFSHGLPAQAHHPAHQPHRHHGAHRDGRGVGGQGARQGRGHHQLYRRRRHELGRFPRSGELRRRE